MSHPLRREVIWSFGGPLTPAVKYLIISTVGVFLLQLFWGETLARWLALLPPLVVRLQVWRLVTYLFLHGDPLHILFNMLFLFMFGCEMERVWGSRSFLRFYLACGIGAGLFTLLPIPAFYNAAHIGASGAIYGVLMAYGMYFPYRTILFMLMFPIQVRYFMIITGLMVVYASVGAASSGVSHIAHLGGLVVGYLYLKLGLGRVQVRFGLRDAYRRWRLKRLRKKFEQYYQKRSGGGDGPQYTVH